MLDDALDDLASIRSRPVWKQLPDSAKAALDVPAPRDPQSLESIYEEYRKNVEPYAIGNRHPRFWGWVIGAGTPTGMLGDLLASAMNTNAGAFEQSSVYVEMRVVDWFKELFGFPAQATGLLVSSGSVANLTCLTVARDAMIPSIVDDGVFSSKGRPLVYASEEVHNSVDKDVGVLGLGRSSLRRVRTNDDFTMNIDHLRQMIDEDRASGAIPVCIIGTAGTVATGAIDDLSTLADICREQGMWFHVDGAFGAMAALSETLKAQVKGMERADSIAFDLHKWLSVNYDGGCALIRDPEAHHRSFSVPASYLSNLDGGTASGPRNFGELGLDLSRGFRALKAWMSIKNYGFAKYARMIEKNVAQARYLGSLVEASSDLEIVAPVLLNVVCFRYKKAGLSAEQLDELNEKILVELQAQGVAVPSGVCVRGRFALRVANVNHRSVRADFDLLVDNVLRIGRRFQG